MSTVIFAPYSKHSWHSGILSWQSTDASSRTTNVSSLMSPIVIMSNISNVFCRGGSRASPTNTNQCANYNTKKPSLFSLGEKVYEVFAVDRNPEVFWTFFIIESPAVTSAVRPGVTAGEGAIQTLNLRGQNIQDE